MPNSFNRREFLKDSAVGLPAMTMGLRSVTNHAYPLGAPTGSARRMSKAETIGRPVRLASIGFHAGRLPLEQIASLVDREGARGTDIIVLPETCRGQNETSEESLDDPTITTMARLAKQHGTYIVCPIDRRDGEQRFNSVVLLDRQGIVSCIYNKMYPVWATECMKRRVLPGPSAQVYQTDLGKVGFAICFDVNWPALWEQLSNHGAELVLWPSAYSAGRSLQAQAIQYNYYVVSATWVPDCLVFDIDGQQLIHETNNQSDGRNVTRITLDLDRCIFHQDLNRPEKIGRLLKERGDDVAEEKWMPLEGWFVLKAKRPGVCVRELAQEYGLEELKHYINRSRCEIDKCRGWEFS
jgi:predicted amidohydrolase